MRYDRWRNIRRCAEPAYVLWVVRMRMLPAGIGRLLAIRRIGRKGSYVGEGDALRLAKERHEDERSENGALNSDRNCQGAAANASLAPALLGVAINETSVKYTETFFGDFFRNFLRIERHHTPPQDFLRGWVALRSRRAK